MTYKCCSNNLNYKSQFPGNSKSHFYSSSVIYDLLNCIICWETPDQSVPGSTLPAAPRSLIEFTSSEDSMLC